MKRVFCVHRSRWMGSGCTGLQRQSTVSGEHCYKETAARWAPHSFSLHWLSGNFSRSPRKQWSLWYDCVWLLFYLIQKIWVQTSFFLTLFWAYIYYFSSSAGFASEYQGQRGKSGSTIQGTSTSPTLGQRRRTRIWTHHRWGTISNGSMLHGD